MGQSSKIASNADFEVFWTRTGIGALTVDTVSCQRFFYLLKFWLAVRSHRRCLLSQVLFSAFVKTYPFTTRDVSGSSIKSLMHIKKNVVSECLSCGEPLFDLNDNIVKASRIIIWAFHSKSSSIALTLWSLTRFKYWFLTKIKYLLWASSLRNSQQEQENLAHGNFKYIGIWMMICKNFAKLLLNLGNCHCHYL